MRWEGHQAPLAEAAQPGAVLGAACLREWSHWAHQEGLLGASCGGWRLSIAVAIVDLVALFSLRTLHTFPDTYLPLGTSWLRAA